jgi:hypothetical protein
MTHAELTLERDIHFELGREDARREIRRAIAPALRELRTLQSMLARANGPVGEGLLSSHQWCIDKLDKATNQTRPARAREGNR